MTIKIYPPTDYIITEDYMDKVVTTDSTATESPVPNHTTTKDSNKVVVSKEDGYVDDSFVDYPTMSVSLPSYVDTTISSGSYPSTSLVITDTNGKIYADAIDTLTDAEITEIFDSVTYP